MSKIQTYLDNNLSPYNTVLLFSDLIKSGEIDKLSDHFISMKKIMILNGILDKNGEILDEDYMKDLAEFGENYNGLLQ